MSRTNLVDMKLRKKWMKGLKRGQTNLRMRKAKTVHGTRCLSPSNSGPKSVVGTNTLPLSHGRCDFPPYTEKINMPTARIKTQARGGTLRRPNHYTMEVKMRKGDGLVIFRKCHVCRLLCVL